MFLVRILGWLIDAAGIFVAFVGAAILFAGLTAGYELEDPYLSLFAGLSLLAVGGLLIAIGTNLDKIIACRPSAIIGHI